MSDKGKETAIDIGAGWGEYFVDRAKENPDKTFILLDSYFPNIRRLPPNLRLVRWVSDSDSGLPFKSSSVDEANINFLMGEIKSKEDKPEGETIEMAHKKYERIIKDLLKCLKKGAILQIIDARENIFAIEEILKRNNFTIKTKPTKLENMNQTRWTKTFYDVFVKSGRPEEDSFALPMKLTATLKEDPDKVVRPDSPFSI